MPRCRSGVLSISFWPGEIPQAEGLADLRTLRRCLALTQNAVADGMRQPPRQWISSTPDSHQPPSTKAGAIQHVGDLEHFCTVPPKSSVRVPPLFPGDGCLDCYSANRLLWRCHAYVGKKIAVRSSKSGTRDAVLTKSTAAYGHWCCAFDGQSGFPGRSLRPHRGPKRTPAIKRHIGSFLRRNQCVECAQLPERLKRCKRAVARLFGSGRVCNSALVSNPLGSCSSRLNG